MELSDRGSFFSRKSYVPIPLPRFDETRGSLPAPIFDEQPFWIEVYEKAWEIAFRNIHEPGPGSSLVSQFIDAAFNENIFLWDSCFMTMFCDVAHPLVPGISTLDNFYANQHPTGEISREINRETGIDFGPWRNVEDRPLFSRWGFNRPKAKGPFPVDYGGRDPPPPNPRVTLDGLNHPLLAWSELEHYRWTGDRDRLALVWPALLAYYRALQNYLRRSNGLFMTDWASMDNSPRNRFLEGGGCGVDISSEMVLFGRQLARIAAILGNVGDPASFECEASRLSALINEKMWDPDAGFYFDLTRDDELIRIKTVAAYWTLLAGIASEEQAEALVQELHNPRTFGRRNPIPTCAADVRGYRSYGGYWRGAVWAPTNTMVIRGLERTGRGDLAREIALRHIALVADVYRTTGTLWENYAPDAPKPGRILPAVPVRRDFIGWTGIGPILFVLEHAIGLRPDAPANRLEWSLSSEARCGCRLFRFNGHVASLVADPAGADGTRRIEVSSDGAFTLAVRWKDRSRDIPIGKGSVAVTM
jgi:hypothetical protein